MAAEQVTKDLLSGVFGPLLKVVVVFGVIRILVEILKQVLRPQRRRRRSGLTVGQARFILGAIFFIAVELLLWCCYGTVGRLLALLMPLFGIGGLVVVCMMKKRAPPTGLVSAAALQQSHSHYEPKMSSKDNYSKPFPDEDAERAVRAGEKGEAMVRDIIKSLPSDRYVALHDVWLPMEDGGEAQIDHVIVSTFGIFVIETKNWKGKIYADDKSPVWTKYNCGHKNTYKNPIRQNYKHIVSIREKFFRLELEFVFGVVAMSPKADFKYGVPKGVVYYNELSSWIMGYVTPLIKPEQVPEIVSVIQEWSSTVSEESRRRHCGTSGMGRTSWAV